MIGDAEESAPGCMRRRAARLVPHSIKRFLLNCYWSCRQFIQDWQEYSAELVGHVPSHAFRLWWYRRVCHMQIGEHTSVHRGCRVYRPWHVTIGDHCVINHGVLLAAQHGLTIGNNVSNSEGTAIITGGHDIDDPLLPVKGGRIIIEDYVFIGSFARLLRGVTVGKGAVIAAGAVVTHDVLPLTVVGGTPARYIRDRASNLSYQLYYRKRFG